jgi:hypothetical protein
MTYDTGTDPDPAGQEDAGPQISVSAGTAGLACEVLRLVSELFAADPAAVAAAFRFLHRKGADPEPATAWLTAAIGASAQGLDAALAFEGISVDRELARYWRRPAVTR